jgi:hypothetical protein
MGRPHYAAVGENFVRKLACLVAVLVGSGLLASVSSATTFGFGCITSTSLVNCAIGAAQLSVDVTADPDVNQVVFKFNNIGGAAASITDVYFDDGTLLGIAALRDRDDSITDLGGYGDAGVDFSQGASPPNLPGGNAVNFHVTAGFLADSDAPVQSNGVNPNEYLQIVFNLQSGKTFTDTLNALALGAGTGGLRIGIHVQAIGTGGSESFVNAVPEPGTFALLALGLGGLATAGRRSD